MKKKALTQQAITAIRSNPGTISRIIDATGKSYPTILSWLRKNDIKLTQADCLGVICKDLKKEPSEVLA